MKVLESIFNSNQPIPFRVSQRIWSVFLALILMVSSLTPHTSNAESCEDIHLDKANKVLVSQQLSSAKIAFSPYVFNGNPNKALFDLLAMTANTRDVKIEGKRVQKGKIRIGIDLGHEYSIEVSYVQKSKIIEVDNKTIEEAKLYPEEVTLVSPAGSEVRIIGDIKDFHTGKLSNTEFDLGLYPFNEKLAVKIPEVIEGALLEKFKGLSSRIGLFTKADLLGYIRTENLPMLRVKGQILWFKNFIIDYFGKMPKKLVSRSIEYGIIFGSAFVISHLGGSKTNANMDPASGPAKTSNTLWISQAQQHLQLKLSAQAQKELGEIQNSMLIDLSKEAIRRPVQLNSPHFLKVDDHSLAWVVEKRDPDTREVSIYLALSYDDLSGNLHYVMTAIDASKQAQLIKELRSLQQVVRTP